MAVFVCMFFVEGGPLCSMHGRDWPVERTAPLAGRSGWRPSVYFSVSSHRGRINEPGVEDTGGERGEYRARAPMAFLDFEIMMLDL